MARTKGDSPATTALERAAKSLEELVARGGPRFNLKLSPEANAALKIIVETEKHEGDTAAINATLILRAQELKVDNDKKGKAEK